MYDIIYYVLAAGMAAVSGAWALLAWRVVSALRHMPRLEPPGRPAENPPKVSVLIPAMNEEKYVGACLESLAAQDYPDYEIIAVNDNSTDDTGRIIAGYAERHRNIIHVDADPRPAGWNGKNWPYCQAYKSSSGQLLLFIDADSTYAGDVISSTVGRLESRNLDAVTAFTAFEAIDPLTKAVLPVHTQLIYGRGSAFDINDPDKERVLFQGSFYMMRREVYEAIGTHEATRDDVMEDNALAIRTKDAGYSIELLLGHERISGLGPRDPKSVWDMLAKQSAVRYAYDRRGAVLITAALSMILGAPLPALAAALAAALAGIAESWPLLASSAVATSIMISSTAVEARCRIKLKARYALLAPIGGLVIALGSIAGLGRGSYEWRGRKEELTRPSGARR